MALKVSFSHPHMPKDEEADIPGIGLVKNGGSKTLTADEEEAFVSSRGMSVKEAFKGNEQIKVEGTSEVKVSSGGEG